MIGEDQINNHVMRNEDEEMIRMMGMIGMTPHLRSDWKNLEQKGRKLTLERANKSANDNKQIKDK